MVGLIAFFVYIATHIGGQDMSLLYGDLAARDSGQIISKLEAMNVPVQVKGDGAIYVPGDKVGRLRMLLAQDGLPNGASLGYEIFDKSEGLATSNFVQNINLVRALEGELSRTISALQPVKSARVHLVLPQREAFSRQKQDPSASIVLQMRSGRLEAGQIMAIQHLVAAAVPGLKPNQVSIIDEQGSLLARGGDETSSGGANAEEARIAFERRMVSEIESLLEKSVGAGKVRAEVTAEMDFDRITTSAELYDPEGRVARSQNTVEESNTSAEGSSGSGPVGVQGNLPEGQGAAGASASNSNKSGRTEETVNYEISKTIKQQVREAPQLKKLSVAVLVDGMYTTDKDGKATYQARPEDNLKQLETLVKTAIGFSDDRGDTVKVVNMQFVAPEVIAATEEAGGFMGLEKRDLMKLVETLVMGLVGILALLLVVRPMIMRLTDVGAGGGARVGGGRAVPQLAAPSSGGGSSQAALPEPEMTNTELDEMINLKQIEGRIKTSSLKRISEIVEKHPDETLSIIRSWLYQGKTNRGDD
jgi:flagellar M-ring protein FliF